MHVYYCTRIIKVIPHSPLLNSQAVEFNFFSFILIAQTMFYRVATAVKKIPSEPPKKKSFPENFRNFEVDHTAVTEQILFFYER